MKTNHKASIVFRTTLSLAFSLLPGTAQTPAPANSNAAERWEADLDLLTAPGGEASQRADFTFSQEGSKVTIHLQYGDRTIIAKLQAERAAFVPPLGNRVRLRDPWVSLAELRTRKPFTNHGWNLWDGRPTTVHAAASGIVLSSRIDPVYGAIVEIGHGSGFRTRYLLNRYGTSVVVPGTQVSVGDAIGELGNGLPDDIPFVHFGLLLDAGKGELVALDPTPFIFGSASNRALPLATSLLNAAIRSGNQTRVSQLLGLGFDPNGKAVDGTLPLEWAIMMRDAGMARLLVAAGGNRNAKTAEHVGGFLESVGPTIAHSGPTLAESAEESGDPELIAALAEP